MLLKKQQFIYILLIIFLFSSAADLFESGKCLPGSEECQRGTWSLQAGLEANYQMPGVWKQPKADPLHAVLPFSVQHYLFSL